MIIQKTDKKKLFKNIIILVVVFGLTGYLILANFVSFDLPDEGVLSDNVVNSKNTFVKKYKNLKKISLDIFEDSRYKNLVEGKEGYRPNLEKGNSNPFKIE